MNQPKKASLDFKHLTREDNPAEYFINKDNQNGKSFWVITAVSTSNLTPLFVRKTASMLWTEKRSLAQIFPTIEDAKKAVLKTGGFIKEAIRDNQGLRDFIVLDWM